MKRTSLTVAILLFLAGPASVLAEDQAISAESQAVLAEAQAVSAEAQAVLAEEQAVLVEEQAVLDNTPVTVVSEAEASTSAIPAAYNPMQDGGAKHKRCDHSKGQGKGQGGMMRGGGKHKKGMHDKHEQVVQRLDMIEARMAKIEAMLEILMRR